MRSKIIGIGISCFNRLENVKKILHTLREHQLTQKYQIVFASDGCTDGTQSFLKEQKDVVLVSAENQGVAANKNRLLRMLKSFKYIFLFEDDILLVDPSLFDHVVEVHKQTGLHHFNYGCLATYKPKKYNKIDLSGSGDLNGQFVFITQKVLEKVGYFNPAFKGYGYEHCEWTFRICKAGFYQWVPYYMIAEPKKFFEFLPETGGMPQKTKSYWLENQNAELFCDVVHHEKFKIYQPEPKETLSTFNTNLSFNNQLIVSSKNSFCSRSSMPKYPADKVTIGMTTFNRWPYTERTLNHLFKFTHPATEIIIVDNASTDGTIDNLKNYLSAARSKGLTHQVKLIENKENLGVGKAINLAFNQGKGELLIKLDNDILVCNKWIYYLWLVYNHFGKKFGACCLEVRDLKGGIRLPRSRTKGHTTVIPGGLLFEHTPAVNGATMTMSRDFWSKNKFAEDRLYGHEDARLAVRAYKKGLICGQLRSLTSWVTHLQHDKRYFKYDLWKNNVAKLGRSFKFEAKTSCYPLEGDDVAIRKTVLGELRELREDPEAKLKARIKKELYEELCVELRNESRKEFLEELKNLVRDDLKEELKKMLTLWF